MKIPSAPLLTCFVGLICFVGGADWPQWRGPGRDGVSRETGLLKKWPKAGPTLRWIYRNAGVGYSTPAVVGDRLYLMGGRGESEYVFALDLKKATDKEVPEIWAVKIGPLFTWKGNSWNAGPSATPTVDGNFLYALSGQGDLVCVNISTGKAVWRISMLDDFHGHVKNNGGVPERLAWGYSWSPLVDGDQVICEPGGQEGMLVALDKKTGKLLWRSKELPDASTYASTVVATLGGVRQYVQITNRGVGGIAAKDGKLLWFYTREEPYGDIVACTPLVQGDFVYATAAPQGGCDILKVTASGQKFNVEKIYTGSNIANHHGGVVLLNNCVYGSSGDGSRAKWTCQELPTGKVRWSKQDRKVSKGSLIYADGCLYCFAERSGLVALVEASPKGWKLNGQFTLPEESKLRKPSGAFWTHPVVANGRLYLRDQDLLFCYDVKGK